MKTNGKDKQLYTVFEVAKICGVHSATVKRWIKKHDIPQYLASEYVMLDDEGIEAIRAIIRNKYNMD